MFLNPNIFSNLNSNCSNLSGMRNLQKQVKKAFCYQKLFWPFTVWINCSSDLKKFANSQSSSSNFKSFSPSIEQFFLTVGQNNVENKIPITKKNDLLFFMMTTTIGFQAINTTQDEQRYKEKAHKSDYDPLVWITFV